MATYILIFIGGFVAGFLSGLWIVSELVKTGEMDIKINGNWRWKK
jgi:hypothetical protein